MIEGMRTKIPKVPKGLMSPEGERYIGTLLENIQGKFDLIMEHLDFSDKRTGKLEKRVDQTETRLDNIELQLLDGE